MRGAEALRSHPGVQGAQSPREEGAGALPRPYVAIAGVTKTYRRARRETHALAQVDLTIRQGEFMAIVGPSGCGKSTLLRLVAGLHLPTAGDVHVDGTRVDRPQTNLGIVFQSPVLLDWRTALDNVLMQIELRGGDTRAYRDRALTLLDQVGLRDFADRYPYELSGGMRQRVAIARALIHDAPLLLMDEPFGALDALTREQMRLDLEALWLATRKTVLFVTHDIDEAVFMGSRVVVMSARPGRIKLDRTVALAHPRHYSVKTTPAFAALKAELTEAVRTEVLAAQGLAAAAA